MRKAGSEEKKTRHRSFPEIPTFLIQKNDP
jgi:hypothetical protein